MTPVLTLHLLGPFHAQDRDQPLTTFATDKVRALLVYLAMEADIPHRRESLATLFYPDANDRLATDNLRKTLHRLRTALDHNTPTLSETLLTITRTTIQLNGSALMLDAARFRQTVTNRLGKSRLSDDDMERLAAVVALYRGEFAAGLSVADAQPFEEWLLLQRLAFHQQALYVCDVLTTAYESRGQFVAAQGYARQALALEPWREEAHLHLIRLLASNGQKSEALAQFERCRQVLADEMGMDPSDEVLALVRQIRKGEFQPPSLPTSLPPRSRLHRFPAQFTSFVGREAELHTVVGQLCMPDCRLVTLVGAGGMGKTRLSVQVAQRLVQNDEVEFAEGLYFVDCSPLIRVEDVPSTIAMAVGLALQGGSSATEQVHAFLRAKSVLLVLDNVEQIIGCASDVAALLAACPQVKLLVTSREPLHLRAEWRYELEGLETKGGIESKAAHLFLQRARQVVSTFTPSDDDVRAIQQIVEQVGGHPLAIELAATWLRFYECPAIAEEIAKGLDFLETNLRDVPARHRSIRVLFEHSWELLTPNEQKTLRHLSVLRGEWTLAQGTAVANGTPRELVKLSDKSLIRRTHAGRYAIDELIRQFALEQIHHEAERSEVESRCVAFFLKGLARHQQALYGMEPQTAVSLLRADWVNIRQAWGMAIALRLWTVLEEAIRAYYMFVELTGLVADGLTDIQSLLAHIQAEPDTLRLSAMAHIYVAEWFFQRAHYAQAHDHANAVLALPDRSDIARWRGYAWYVRANSDLVQGRSIETILTYLAEATAWFTVGEEPLGQAKVLALHATIAQKQGVSATAIALHAQALAQFEQLHYPLGMMQTLSHMGVTYRRIADYEQALAHHLRCLELAERLNSPAELARHHNNIGVVYRALQAYDQAIDHFTRAMETDQLLGHQRGVAIEKGNLGLIYQAMYRYDEALAYYGESVEIARSIGLKGVEANYLGCRGELYAELGHFEVAITEIEKGIEVARAIGNPTIASTYSGILAWVYFCGGDRVQGLRVIEEALVEQHRYNLREAIANSLYFKGRMLVEVGEDEAAWATVQEAIALRRTIGVAGVPLFQLQVLAARLHHRLGHHQAAVESLETLRDQPLEEEALADALFGLWDVTRHEPHRQAAIAFIKPLFAKNPRHEYQQRLALLANG
jgi:predicted ATPase/DNA-binding SARP family transcriptional activator